MSGDSTELSKSLEKWQFGDGALSQYLILKQEMERTKQEQIKQQSLELALQILQKSIDAHIPGHMIPNVFNSGASAAPAAISANNSAATAKNAAHDTSSTISDTNDESYHVTPFSPLPSLPPLSRYPLHQRSSTISSTKDLYRQPLRDHTSRDHPILRDLSTTTAARDQSTRESTDASISNQYITHSSPFKFPLSFASVPESRSVIFENEPKTAKPPKQGEPAAISSYQHVIQFNQWQSEDPAANYGHQRRRSNPEVKPARVMKPGSPTHNTANGATGILSKTKTKLMGHSRTKSDIGALRLTKENIFTSTPLKGKEPQHSKFTSLVNAAMREPREKNDK